MYSRCKYTNDLTFYDLTSDASNQSQVTLHCVLSSDCERVFIFCS